MDYEMLSFEKKQFFLDLAGKAIWLRPTLARKSLDKKLPEKIKDLARDIAQSITVDTSSGN
jgi:hypothetical protein